MKSLLLFLIILFAGFTFGQKPEKGAPAKEKVKKEVSKNMKGKKDADQNDDDKQKGKGNNPEKKGKDHDDYDDDDDNKDKVKGKDKEHPGKGHAYGKNKGDLSGREFGMTRAGKTVDGTKIKNDDDAKEIIREVKEENQAVITEVKSKLDQAVDILKQKKEAGEISDEEYIIKSSALELLKKKEEDLKKRILGGN